MQHFPLEATNRRTRAPQKTPALLCSALFFASPDGERNAFLQNKRPVTPSKGIPKSLIHEYDVGNGVEGLSFW